MKFYYHSLWITTTWSSSASSINTSIFEVSPFSLLFPPFSAFPFFPEFPLLIWMLDWQFVLTGRISVFTGAPNEQAEQEYKAITGVAEEEVNNTSVQWGLLTELLPNRDLDANDPEGVRCFSLLLPTYLSSLFFNLSFPPFFPFPLPLLPFPLLLLPFRSLPLFAFPCFLSEFLSFFHVTHPSFILPPSPFYSPLLLTPSLPASLYPRNLKNQTRRRENCSKIWNSKPSLPKYHFPPRSYPSLSFSSSQPFPFPFPSTRSIPNSLSPL